MQQLAWRLCQVLKTCDLKCLLDGQQWWKNIFEIKRDKLKLNNQQNLDEILTITVCELVEIIPYCILKWKIRKCDFEMKYILWIILCLMWIHMCLLCSVGWFLYIFVTSRSNHFQCHAHSESVFVCLFVFISVVHAKEKPPINVVGDVAGHIAIVVVSIIFTSNLKLSLWISIKK